MSTYCLSPDVTTAAWPIEALLQEDFAGYRPARAADRARSGPRGPVPPVKSIENLRPSWPPVRKVRMMKIRPGW
jgi:hypothetical protein